MELAQHFRCKVKVEAPPRTDDFGILGLVNGWETVLRTWAAVDPTLAASARLGGMEVIAGRQTQSIATHVVTMKFTRLVKPEHRIVWKNRYLQIVSITNVQERDVYLRILAKEHLV